MVHLRNLRRWSHASFELRRRHRASSVRTPKVKRVLDGGHTSQLNCVAWSPDGCRVATGANDGTAKMWNVATGTVERTLRRSEGNTVAVTSVAWAGRDMIACYEDGEVRVWGGKMGFY